MRKISSVIAIAFLLLFVSSCIPTNIRPLLIKSSGLEGLITLLSNTFSLIGTDADGTIAKYEYREDGGVWEDCGLATTYTWNGYSEGPHTFEVRAQDNLGLFSNVVIWIFTYSSLNQPPVVIRQGGAEGTITSPNNTFFWSGTDNGSIVKYQYRKDGGGWVDYGLNTSYTWSNYSKGNHIFEVRAQDDEGLYSSIVFWAFFYEPPVPKPGTLLWKYKTGGQVRSSPAIDSYGTIYFGSDDGFLYAVDSSGKLKWKYNAGSPISSSPTIGSSGAIYFGSHDGYLYALDKTGVRLWRRFLGSAIYSSPAIGYDGAIYVTCYNDYVYALNPDGTQRWSRGTSGIIRSSPAIGTDSSIHFGAYDKVYALNPSGTTKWSFTVGYIFSHWVNSSPAIDSTGRVYVGAIHGYFYCLSGYSGSKLWEKKVGGDLTSSPVIDNNGNIYFGSSDGYFNCLNPSGSYNWSFSTYGSIYSTPALGSDGTIVFGSHDGRIYALKSNGKLKWSYVTGGQVSSSAAIGDDGTIYIGSSDGYLYAIADNNGGLMDSAPWPKFQKDNANSGRY